MSKKYYPVRFSLVIPVYNEEKNIVNLLNNLLRLYYDKNKYEIIIQDDCSQDKTFQIAKSFEKVNTHLKVYKNKKNLGIAHNRNAAAHNSAGEILIHMDADAFYPYNTLQIIDNNFKAFNLIALGGILLPKENGPVKVTPFDRIIFNTMKPLWSIIGATGNLFCIRREVFWEFNGFREPNGVKGREDLDLWYRLEKKYKDKMKVDQFLPTYICLKRLRAFGNTPKAMVLGYAKLAGGYWQQPEVGHKKL